MFVRLESLTYGEKEPSLLVIERGTGTVSGSAGILAVANLSGASSHSLAEVGVTGREMLLSTEAACYGGSRRNDGFPSESCPTSCWFSPSAERGP